MDKARIMKLVKKVVEGVEADTFELSIQGAMIAAAIIEAGAIRDAGSDIALSIDKLAKAIELGR